MKSLVVLAKLAWIAAVIALWPVFIHGVATRWWTGVAGSVCGLAALVFVSLATARAPTTKDPLPVVVTLLDAFAAASPMDAIGVVLVVPMIVFPAMCFAAILS